MIIFYIFNKLNYLNFFFFFLKNNLIEKFITFFSKINLFLFFNKILFQEALFIDFLQKKIIDN